MNFIATELHKGFVPLFAKEAGDAYKAVATEKLAGRLGLLDRPSVQAALEAEGFSKTG